jgi:hypothetical protein
MRKHASPDIPDSDWFFGDGIDTMQLSAFCFDRNAT